MFYGCRPDSGSKQARDEDMATALGQLCHSRMGWGRGWGSVASTLLDLVQGHVNRARIDLVVAGLPAPCCWNKLGVYLQQTMPEFVQHAEPGLLPS